MFQKDNGATSERLNDSDYISYGSFFILFPFYFVTFVFNNEKYVLFFHVMGCNQRRAAEWNADQRWEGSEPATLSTWPRPDSQGKTHMRNKDCVVSNTK